MTTNDVDEHKLASCKNCGTSLSFADRIGRNLLQRLLMRSQRFQCRACGKKQFLVSLPKRKPLDKPNPPDSQAVPVLTRTQQPQQPEVIKHLKIENARLTKVNEVLLMEIKRIQKEKRGLQKINSLLKKSLKQASKKKL